MATINLRAQGCVDCGVWVEAQQGALYRHSGANMRVHGKRLKRNRYSASPFTYVVRCRTCADTRDDSPYKATVETDAARSCGYSEACGVWN